MHDDEVTRALIGEIEAMGTFNDWVLGHLLIGDRNEEVRNGVRLVTQAHRRVIATHKEWIRHAANKAEVLTACSEFEKLVSVLTSESGS
jgi:hypothetical protein